MASQRVAQIAGHLNYPKGMLAGQVAIITGSGQGIGAEAARLFANEGAKVVVQDIDATKAQAVAKSINDNGGTATAIPGDMLDANYINNLVKNAAEFGNGKIHIIVNNAGFTWDAVIHKMTDNNGIPSSLSTTPHHSNSSAPLHPTSASKTANQDVS